MEIKTVFLSSYILLLLTIIISTSPVYSVYYSENTAYKSVQLKRTNLRFFFHDNLGGMDPTAVQISGPTDPNNPIPFGALFARGGAQVPFWALAPFREALAPPLLFAIDDPSPELTSRVVGNARGMYLSSGRGNDVALVLYVDLGFTAGALNGSSLSVFSRNPVVESRREMAVVGGRGLFRRAEGTVFVTTYFVNLTYAVLEYNVEEVESWFETLKRDKQPDKMTKCTSTSTSNSGAKISASKIE
ncbi:hypothetical protein OROHE_004310 [Orobanche hederae]